jgi:phosphoesterase RecJ-like protein
VAPGPPTDDLLSAGEDSARARSAAAALLRRARRVVLTAHEKPDADGVGSALGLVLVLRSLGVEAAAAFPSPLPGNLSFLPGASEAPVVPAGTPPPDSLRGADVVVALDSGAASRLGGLEPLGRAAPAFLNLDHHASNDGFGTHRWIDPRYSATGVMAFELACEMGAALTAESCLCFYTALVYDTGGFAYSNTDPRSHRMAATCIDRGVRPERVTAALHRGRTASSYRFEGEALARMATTEDGAVAWISLPRDLRSRHGMTDGNQPELIEAPVRLATTRIGALLTELEDGRVRVSLRSRCRLGVHEIAARNGGGGHARAAGMTVDGPLDAVEKRLVPALQEALRDCPGPRGPDGLPAQDA